MSDGVRGRVLIININNFSYTRKVRQGSQIDYSNLRQLFRDLKFEIVKSENALTDLTAQVERKCPNSSINPSQ